MPLETEKAEEATKLTTFTALLRKISFVLRGLLPIRCHHLFRQEPRQFVEEAGEAEVHLHLVQHLHLHLVQHLPLALVDPVEAMLVSVTSITSHARYRQHSLRKLYASIIFTIVLTTSTTR